MYASTGGDAYRTTDAMKNYHRITIIFVFTLLIAIIYVRQGFTAGQDEQQKLAQQAVTIFQNNCLRCHGADMKSGLDLRTRESILKGGNRGAAIIPNNSKDSLLYQFISGAKSPRMPIGGELDEDDIETIENWIDKGAIWPTTIALKVSNAPIKEKEITAEHRKYWAFVSPVKSEVPKIAGYKNPIDAFIVAELNKKGLTLSPSADKATLLRRVTFDLTGLPPTPEEIKAFLNDKSPNAYEKIVDKLLASPRYGERWAQHWLDVVRFGETNGFELDAERPQAWRYRDYVVNSLNADKPYDRFIQEQIAGDEIDPENFEAQIATGFLRAGPQHVVSGNLDKAELRQEYLTETMLGLGSGIMGLTVGCARCHDHKFDPILQSDFYKMQAFFAATDNDTFSKAPISDFEKYQASMKSHKEKIKPITDQIELSEKPFKEKLKEKKLSELDSKYAEALKIPKESRTPEQKEIAKDAERMIDVKYEELLMVMPDEPKAKRAALRRQMHDMVWQEPTPIPKALVVADKLSPIPPAFVFKGGEVHSPIVEVQPNFPKVFLPPNSNETPNIIPTKSSTGRRTALAKWLTSPDNPLTARVMVNRLWHQHFGRGLVATPNDFGRNGSGVTNQKLLDWLAVEFMNADFGLRNAELKTASPNENILQKFKPWSMKNIHRLMVTSATYRQSSALTPQSALQNPHSTLPNPQSLDPENKLLWRANRQRLDAEALRDAILASSSVLNEERGGPSIRVPMEPEVVETIFTEYEPDNLWPVHPDTKQHTRRSLYLLHKRNVKLPMLVAFDTPDLQSVCGARNVSVHSLQALTLMNSQFMQDQSKALARRILGDAKTTQNRLVSLYELTLGRAPRAEEIKAANIFLKEQSAILKARKARGEEIVTFNELPANIDPITAAAWVDLCLATLNLNEFVYIK